MHSHLESVGLLDLLNSDPRPTFVVELPFPGYSQPCQIIHQNPALSANTLLRDAIFEIPRSAIHRLFWEWVTTSPATPSGTHGDSPFSHTISYQDTFWTRHVVQDRWAVMSGNDIPPSTEPPRKIRHESSKDGSLPRPHARENSASEMEIDPEPRTPAPLRAEQDQGLMPPDFSPDTEPFLDAIQSVDWDSHPLGPIDEWPTRLQQAFNVVIPDSRAIGIYWGSDYTAIYNEAFSRLCGASHPALLGNSIIDVWPHLKPSLERVRGSPQSKSAQVENETRTFIEKPDGTLEETYIKSSLVPIMDQRKCVGIQHSILETTSMRLWERRMKFLLDLGNATVTARDLKSYWNEVLGELERLDPSYDVPLAFIYSIVDDDEIEYTQQPYSCRKICRLEGALGVEDGHPLAPAILELRASEEGLAPMFREALNTEFPLLLQTKDDTLPERLLHNLQWRGFGDPCQAAIICPIRPTMEESVMGFLFLGLNPRRPYDNDYRQFIHLLNQQLASSLASTVLLEEEERRGRNAAEQAAFDTEMLQRKLEYQTEQANRSIQNFKAVAEFIPVGMSFHDNHGNVTFANDAWHRITGYPKVPIRPGALLECVLEEDKPKIVGAYEAIQLTDVVTFEFRVPRSINPPDGSYMPTTGTLSGLDERVGRHVLASAKAERAADGTVARMLTCLTDVTVQKHTAEEAVRRAQVAENLKRLAEFATVGMYDMTMDGQLLSANNLFWELSGLSKVDLSKVIVRPWQACVLQEDLEVLEQSMGRLKLDGRPEQAEIRLKTFWTVEDAAGNKITAPRWVLATFMPVKSSDGTIESCTGCLSDVSLQKWQLEQEKLRKEEALESKRQQESFIDMTSHEMRNPLSAILHCTDAIIASLSRTQEVLDGSAPMSPTVTTPGMAEHASAERKPIDEERRLLEDSISMAETIVECAQHQKRIVDDILTMSKLDSKLLAVTPCTVNPAQIMQDALKMFEVEARRVDIVLTSVIDKSYTDLGHEFLDLDPSRVKQVLINLLTNALKFTKTGKTRNVTIRIKGSRDSPPEDLTVANFIPRFVESADEYEQPWLRSRQNPVYLLFEVQDTGQGLSSVEMSNLFNKFVQASAKTHVKYGGSGLGLFISRRLTELQNGAIGVSSRPGVGSTFAFYIEAYVPSEKARKEAEKAAKDRKHVSGQTIGSVPLSRRGTASRGSQVSQREANLLGHARLDGILVVEDNLINQQITRRGLMERGYSVDVANHGIEALEKLRRSVGARARPMADIRSPPGSRARSQSRGGHGGDGAGGTLRGSPNPQPIPINLVLMDIEMPVQDGLTCTRHIRELEREGSVFCASGGRIPIVAVTANARPEQVTEAIEAGCDDVLVKPYRIPELVETMQVIVRKMGGLSPEAAPVS